MEVPQTAPGGTVCIRCGISLRGIRIDAVCPGCWMPIDQSLGAVPKRVPDSATCVRCAYSLRGLRPEGVCPECGLPVERSLRGDLLLYSDPEYIRKLLTGSRLVLWATVAIICILIAEVVVGITRQRDLTRVLALAALGANVTFCAGWWMLTWPDAAQLSTNKGQRPRRVVRWTLGVILCFMLGSAGAPMFRGLLPPEIEVIAAVLGWLAMGAGFWSGMLYIRWLAPRVPDGSINKLAKSLLIVFGSIIGAMVVMAFGAIFSAGNRGEAACFSLLLLAGVVIASIGAIVMYCTLFAKLRDSLLTIADAQRTAGPGATSPRDSPAA